MDPSRHEYRCKHCKKLFFKGVLVDSEVEIKCKRCGETSLITGIKADEYVCWKLPCPFRIAVGEKPESKKTA